MDHLSPNSQQLCDALDGKEIPVDHQESSAPAALDLVSSSSPFSRLNILDLQIRCDHSTFGIESTDCADLNRDFISDTIPHSTGAGIRGWRRNYAGAYIIDVYGHPIFNTSDFEYACASSHAALTTHPKTVITLTLTLAPSSTSINFVQLSGHCSKYGRLDLLPRKKCLTMMS
jgi:hypothetical protein